ncbi:MAG: response regulator [Bacteroidetes bacterium]|jgi:two-component system chemotaxis response regulator CheY|nr:response regulator [Bacteroidota bacterium]
MDRSDGISPTASKQKVMVVDDSETIRRFVMFALRARGLQVVTAEDGQQALETLADTPVDLVITDLNMPKLDGFSLVEALRNDGDYHSLPVIILSSLSDREDIDRGMSLGATAYLTKPFDETRIQYEVAKHLP